MIGGSPCLLPGRLDGKIILITGANTGIGLETNAELARRGATIIMACRNMKKAEAAKDDILDRYQDSNPTCLTANVANEDMIQFLTPVKETQLITMEVNLENYDSIKAFAKKVISKFRKIDMLINNAGAFFPESYTTRNDRECHVDINYLGPYLLTELLMEKLIASRARIINVASYAHKFSPEIDLKRLDLLDERKEGGMMRAYGYSKLLNILHALNLNRIYGYKGITAVSLHPGSVKTDLGRNTQTGFLSFLFQLVSPILITPWQGAQTTIYCALLENPKPGAYYENQEEAEISCEWNDKMLQEIWLWSQKCVGL